MSAEGLIAAEANSLLGTLTTAFTWVQLHTAHPGAAGTTAVATENTRKQVSSWGSASGGSIATAADLAWTSVAGSETYAYYSLWSASTAGTCGFTGAVTANPVTAGDNFTIPSGDLTASFTVAS